MRKKEEGRSEVAEPVVRKGDVSRSFARQIIIISIYGNFVSIFIFTDRRIACQSRKGKSHPRIEGSKRNLQNSSRKEAKNGFFCLNFFKKRLDKNESP